MLALLLAATDVGAAVAAAGYERMEHTTFNGWMLIGWGSDDIGGIDCGKVGSMLYPK